MSSLQTLSSPAPRRDRPFAALWCHFVAGWRRALEPSSHEAISDATLRDLGIARSELASFRAESDGRAELTRRRVSMREHF